MLTPTLDASAPPRTPGPAGEPPSLTTPSAGRPAEPNEPSWSQPATSGQLDPDGDDIEDPERLQGRSGAAADAYRRLRKLFPS